MKIKTVLIASISAGVGYVLGTKAGRARFEEIRSRTKEFVESPKVQETVSNLSETVKQNAQKLPDPVANVVSAVADRAKGSSSETGSGAESTSGSQPDIDTMYETGAPSATETTFGTTSATETTFGTEPTSPTEPKSSPGL
jgi:hypothetical protein